MPSLAPLLKALDDAFREMGEAFDGLPDADVWRRAHPRLLSVGELAAHVAYWEAQAFFGDALPESPLVTSAARYYTSNAPEPFALDLGAGAVLEEARRVHALCKAVDLPDADAPSTTREGWTWGYVVEYQGFHVAYHVGQMYSVRHLLGHETPDN